MGAWIHRVMLLPTRDIGRCSRQGSDIRSSKHRHSADVTQRSVDRCMIRSYAATILLAVSVSASWDSDVVGSNVESDLGP